MSSRRGEPYTADEIERIRRLAGERRTDDEIGLLLGRGRSSIATIRTRHGIAAGGGTHDPAPAVEPELVERIRKLAGGGWSDERIGRSVGRTWSQVIGPGNPGIGGNSLQNTIAAEARRDAHIARLRERKAARRAAERAGVGA